MWVGIGVGIGRNRFATGIFNDYALRVTADGGITEAGQCVDAVTGLLLNASLLLIPSGYKGGKLYSEIPTNGNGDLTWTRGSDAFRTNASGLIQRVPWNLLQRSEEFNNAIWGKVNSSVSADSTTAPNGTTTADSLIEDSTNNLHIASQGVSFVGGIYTASVYVKPNGRNWVFINIAAAGAYGAYFDVANGVVGTIQSNITSATMTSVGNGWYRCIVTANTGATSPRIAIYTATANGTFSYQGDGTSGLFIWGAQLVEGTTAQTYLPTTDRLNFPRLDYTYGSCPSALLEPQRTNLALRSEEFDNASWSKTESSITANTTTSPDGTTNADSLIENTANALHQIAQSTSATGGVYTATIYAKPNGRNWFLFNIAAAPNYGAYFDVQNGAVGTIQSNITSATITSVGDGWYRCTIIANTASISPRISLGIATANNTISYTGNGTSGLYIYGAQLEAGAYPTTYIPTTSATATRVADSASKTGISSLIGQSEGTVFLDFIFKTPDSSVGGQIGISDSSKANRVILWNNSTFNTLALQLKANNLNAINNVSLGTFVDGTRYKIAIAYKSGDTVVYVNGTQTITNASSFTFASSLTDFILGSYETTLNNGHQFCFKTALFTSRLTNAELATLTT